MINETKVTKTENGGLRIILESESFEADTYPVQDQIGGLLQIKVGDRWIRTEIEKILPIVAPDTKVTSFQSPILDSKIVPTEANNDATVIEAPPEMSIFKALFLAFFGGALLNIMPCVLPVLTLKLFGLIEQADITPRKQRIAGISYSSGIVASFLALALVVVVLQSSFGLNIGWGFQFQYPEYVIALATVVFVFGLSMLGIFELPTLGANKANELSNHGGWLEYFMIGVFATLLATPCSAPFLGTGIGFAFTLPAWGIFAFFAVAGLGLASPFLLVAFYPPFFKILPNPGAWMDTFKEVMGFSLIATTIWLVDVLGAQTGLEGTTGFLLFLLFVSLSAWIFGKWGSVIESGARQIQAFVLAILISTAAGFFFLETDFTEADTRKEVSDLNNLDFSEEVPWQPFSDAAITKLKADKKAIFIDFTADWCLSCKVNEKNVLETETVRNALKENGIIPVKADWTRRDDEISDWLKRYGKAGVPFYLVIGTNGSVQPLPEVLTTGIVLKALKKASEG
jgi:thiol:disulfide interchange protein DsbD